MSNGNGILSRYSRVEKCILAALILASVIAWAYMSALGGGDMGNMVMDMNAGLSSEMESAMLARSAAGISTVAMSGFDMFIPMWAVMCLAMMLPTAIPMIMTMAMISKNRMAEDGTKPSAVYARPLLFTAGYILSWCVLGALVWGVSYAVFALIGGWINAEWKNLWLSVAALFLATGIYQISPLKYACLYGCQHPLVFLMKHWRKSLFGAFLMGVRHAADCIGCCIALMIVMLPLGMMNLVWMVVFTLIMFFEKDARFGKTLSKVVGWLFASAGALGLIFGAIMLII